MPEEFASLITNVRVCSALSLKDWEFVEEKSWENHVLNIVSVMLLWLVAENGAGPTRPSAETTLKLMSYATPTTIVKLKLSVYTKKRVIKSRNANLDTQQLITQHLDGKELKVNQ